MFSVSINDSCDVFGCSVGGCFFAILLHFHNIYIRKGYQDSRFESKTPDVFLGEIPLKTKEVFHTPGL